MFFRCTLVALDVLDILQNLSVNSVYYSQGLEHELGIGGWVDKVELSIDTR